ncbi:beta-xylosidase [Mucilaginibacter sp. L196]|uniref:GH39 family glycosyl hydrolase n=1 Tax=Mucilaginibacter sp. L196 TaxID=1641870 RepID=UPI00131D8036|nr:beta-xylosidase [Mucilaginibacter sp. L196]
MKSRYIQQIITLTIMGLMFSQKSTAQEKAKRDSASIVIDYNNEVGAMNPIWAWFGHDEPNYTYMKDGKILLSELALLSPAPVHLRVHNLLTTGDGTAALKWGSTNAYTEDANGHPIYNWRIIDSIFDVYVKLGIKPYAQIGFMPEALSTHPKPYRHNWQPGKSNELFTGWTYPPKDYHKWEELVYQWVKHSVERYGQKEVESWYWEVWNEPNIGYWSGTRDEFFKLYDYAAHGVKRALPSAKVGGPEVAGGGSPGGVNFLNAFIQHCIHGTNYATGQIGSPLDVISFHAKGQPKLVDGHVRMNMAPQLQDIESGFKIVASYPETKYIPIVIGESDPEGCAACGMATSPENAYRNGTLYSSYTAASFAREYLLADSLQINLMGAVSWSFEFENQPWFYGYRDLATNGVDKPVLNIFRMLGLMGPIRLGVTGSQMTNLQSMVNSSASGVKSDIGALATKSAASVIVMVWNYHDDDIPSVPQPISIVVNNLPVKTVQLTEYRIDDRYSNSYQVWKNMGSPQHPSAKQISKLEKSGLLQQKGVITKVMVHGGKAEMNISLKRQGVSLLKLAW